MLLKLEHTANPDIPNGYWNLNLPKKAFVPISNFKDASQLCQKYIDKYDLGAGNWSGGEILTSNGQKIARVSYNGKVWKLGVCVYSPYL